MHVRRSLGVLFLLLFFISIIAGCSASRQVEAENLTSPSSTTTVAPTTTATPTPVPTPTIKPTPYPTPIPVNPLEEGMKGSEVQRMMEAFCDLGYISEDKITDNYDFSAKYAVMDFQFQNNLPMNGIADKGMLILLYSGIANEADPVKTYAPTTHMTFEELVMSDDKNRDKYPEGYPEPGIYQIIVDIRYQVTMIFSKDEEGNYTVPVRYMLCSTGASHTPTPTGTFKINNYRVRFGQFSTGEFGQYWSQIYGPFYFHSILYTQRDTSSYYTNVWQRIGSQASHGCVRLPVPDAKWIWYNIAPGTECIIRWGDADDEEMIAIREGLVLASVPDTRPSIDPSEIPQTDNWQIDDVAHDIPYVQGWQ